MGKWVDIGYKFLRGPFLTSIKVTHVTTAGHVKVPVNPFLLPLSGGGQEDEGRLEHEEQVHEHPGQEEGHQGLRRAEGASGVGWQSSYNRPNPSSPLP